MSAEAEKIEEWTPEHQRLWERHRDFRREVLGGQLLSKMTEDERFEAILRLVRSEVSRAVAEEREACAKLADKYTWAAVGTDSADIVDKMRHSEEDAEQIALEIRDRSRAKEGADAQG